MLTALFVGTFTRANIENRASGGNRAKRFGNPSVPGI
jgi:hypothetical protein